LCRHCGTHSVAGTARFTALCHPASELTRCSYVKAGTITGRFVDVIFSSSIAHSVR
jgi:hypothetical protein